MNIFLQIFFVLMLQSGSGGSKPVPVDMDKIILSKNMTLNLSGNPDILEQMMLVCSAHDMTCEISREGEATATVIFKNLSFSKQNKIMEQIKPLQRDIVLQWSE